VEDALTKWRREGEERQRRINAETERRQNDERREVEATNQWRDFVIREIRTATMEAAKSIGTAVAESFIERDEVIGKLQRRLDKLELENVKLAAEVAKLNLRVVEADAERGRERERRSDFIPPPSSRRALN